MTGCTYCGTPGCEWETCPERLEDRHGVPSDYDDEGQLKTDGGTSGEDDLRDAEEQLGEALDSLRSAAKSFSSADYEDQQTREMFLKARTAIISAQGRLRLELEDIDLEAALEEADIDADEIVAELEEDDSR